MANPYQSPHADCTSDPAVFDRATLAAGIRAYLDGDHAPRELADYDGFLDSPDDAVRFAAGHVLELVEDGASLRKNEWDFVQRILLLLDSNREIESRTVRRWHWSQLFAAVAFSAEVILIALSYAFDQQEWLLAAVLLGFGIVSAAITWWRSRSASGSPYESIVSPFHSVAELAQTYRSTPFRKQRFPKDLDRDGSRHPFDRLVTGLIGGCLWAAFSPLILLFQVFPLCEEQIRIVRS